MSQVQRRQFTSEQKAEAVKRHLVGKEPVSEVCKRFGIAPNVFYRWQQDLFTHASLAFESKKRGARTKPREAKLESRVQLLEQKLSQKDNVIAEVAEECVKLKKKLCLI